MNHNKIAILGSTGFVGRVLVKKALEKGLKIKALARKPEKLGHLKDQVEVISGDYFNPDNLEKTVSGTEAVLSTVGPPQRNPLYPEKYEMAMKNLVSILEKHKIKRLIHIGGAGHPGGDNEKWPLRRMILKLFLELFWKQGLIAKKLEWEVLKGSSLDWTLVRPPRIVKGRSNSELSADEKNLPSLQVSVEDLVQFMLDQISSDAWIKKAPLVANKG